MKVGGGHRLGGPAHHVPDSLLCLVLVIVPFLVLLAGSFVVVPVGSLGVVSTLGSVSDTPLENGWHLVFPFLAQVNLMSTRLKVLHFADNVPTQEGVNVHLAASCINRLDPAMAVNLFKTVGTDFEQKILLPEFQSIVRAVTSAHTSQALYTAEARTVMMRDLQKGIDQLVSKRGIIVEVTLINKLLLPPAIEFAIEKKMAMEQQAEQMQFVLQKESMMAEQQVIRAQGIASFQNIVSRGLSDRLLRWQGIEATKALADNCNPKTVVIGGSQNMPLILNQPSTDPALLNLTAHLASPPF